MVKFIPRYFILFYFDAIVNGNFIISLSDSSLLVFRKADFCLLILYPVIL